MCIRDSVGGHRLVEGGPAPPDVVGGEEVVGVHDAADLGIDAVHGRWSVEAVRHHAWQVADGWDLVVLELQQDGDGHVGGVGVAPRLHFTEAVLQGEAVGVCLL